MIEAQAKIAKDNMKDHWLQNKEQEEQHMHILTKDTVVNRIKAKNKRNNHFTNKFHNSFSVASL
jgi:hypothetical protein